MLNYAGGWGCWWTNYGPWRNNFKRKKAACKVVCLLICFEYLYGKGPSILAVVPPHINVSIATLKGMVPELCYALLSHGPGRTSIWKDLGHSLSRFGVQVCIGSSMAEWLGCQKLNSEVVGSSCTLTTYLELFLSIHKFNSSVKFVNK